MNISNRSSQLKAATDSAVNEVYTYIKDDLKKFYANETTTLEKIPIKKIGDEASARLKQIRDKKTRLMNSNIIGNNELQAFGEQKEIIAYKNALLKGYAFIMKTREFLTGETVSYLFMVDSFSKDPTIAKLKLEDFLPGINLILSSDGKFKLQLNNIEKLEQIVKKHALKRQSAKDIVNMYKTLRVNKKSSTGKKLLQGFILEQSIRVVAKAPNQEYATDTEAFYRGGDLKGKEIPLGLVGKKENLEVKNLASTRYGAGLANERTIETALISIKQICERFANNPAHFKDVIEKFIFKADKNIDQRIKGKLSEGLEKKVSNALETFVKNITP